MYAKTKDHFQSAILGILGTVKENFFVYNSTKNNLI